MKLGTICDVVRGSSPRPQGDARFYGGPIPRLMVADVTRDGKCVTPRIDTLTVAGAALSRPMKKGDLVIAVSGNPGLPAVLQIDACIHDGFVGLRNLDTSRVGADFLYRFLIHLKDENNGRAVGAIFKNLTTDQIKGIDIPELPMAEQRRIADVLDRAEALRAKRRAALAQLDSLTQSIFLEMFGDPKQNERGWHQLPVGEAGRVQLGRQRAPKYQSGKYTRPYVRVANVYEDRLDLSDVLTMDFDSKDFPAYRLEYGDILLNEGQSTELVGRPAMWRNEIQDCCFQNTLVRFQSNRETTLPEFALALFLHYYRSGEFAKISSKTSNVAHLGAGRFAAMPFPLPPIPLQREFARRMSVAEKMKGAQEASMGQLDALFASLQHRAFRGEL